MQSNTNDKSSKTDVKINITELSINEIAINYHQTIKDMGGQYKPTVIIPIREVRTISEKD